MSAFSFLTCLSIITHTHTQEEERQEVMDSVREEELEQEEMKRKAILQVSIITSIVTRFYRMFYSSQSYFNVPLVLKSEISVEWETFSETRLPVCPALSVCVSVCLFSRSTGRQP